MRHRGANCHRLLQPARGMIFVGLVIFISFGLAFVSPSEVQAASAYLADEIGNTEIAVDVEDEFHVVLWAVDVTKLAGYDCKITISGPATAIGQAAHGDWFADGHSVFDGLTTADYKTAMLLNPLDITGSGDIVVFTLRADEEGTVAINVDSQYFGLFDTDGNVIDMLLPSTLYVTVGSGGDSLGGGEAEDSESAESPGSGEGMLESVTFTLDVQPWPPVLQLVIGGSHGGTTGTEDYPQTIEEDTVVSLIAPEPATMGEGEHEVELQFSHWELCDSDGEIYAGPLANPVQFQIQQDTIAKAFYKAFWLTVEPSPAELQPIEIGGTHGGMTGEEGAYPQYAKAYANVLLQAPLSATDGQDQYVLTHWELCDEDGEPYAVQPFGPSSVRFSIEQNTIARPVYTFTVQDGFVWVGPNANGPWLGIYDFPFLTLADAFGYLEDNYSDPPDPLDPGDYWVIVKDGTYEGWDNWWLKPPTPGPGATLTVTSQNGPATCTINGQDIAYYIFGFSNGVEPADVLIRGFTMTGIATGGHQAVLCEPTGSDEPSSPTICDNVINGSGTALGIYCLRSHPVIRDNTINQADVGIYCQGSSPTIHGNTIQSSVAEAVRCKDDPEEEPDKGSYPQILANTITGDETNPGAGIVFTSALSGTLSIKGNTTQSNSRANGAGIYCSTTGHGQSTIEIKEGNVISGNSATASTGSGGGIYWEALSDSSCTLTVDGNNIEGNDSRSFGGGIYCMSNSPGVQHSVAIHSSTIKNNIAENSSEPMGGGAAIEALQGSTINASVQGNTFKQNTVKSTAANFDPSGGGLYTYRANLTLNNDNVFDGNVIGAATDNGFGAGAYIYQGTIVEITANRFVNNTYTKADEQQTATPGGHGGGIAIRDVSGAVNLKRNRFGNAGQGNKAQAGAGIYISGGTGGLVTLSNCLLVDNVGIGPVDDQSPPRGCGLWTHRSTKIVNCTIAGNRTDVQYSEAGGIFFSSGDHKLINSIVWANTADAAPQLRLAGGSLQVEYTDVVRSQCSGDIGWGDGNIEQYPKFPEELFDPEKLEEVRDLLYWIMPYTPALQGSLCIDVGDNSPDGVEITQYKTDLMGGSHMRLVDGNLPADGVATVDMGCFEMRPNEDIKAWPLKGDANCDCRTNILDLIYIRNKLNQDPSQGENWHADLNRDGRINIGDLLFARNELNNSCAGK